MNATTLSQPIRRTLAVAIAGAFALGFGTIAATAHDFGVPKVNIQYGDLNLATPQGAKVLYERIISASYTVCRSYDLDGLGRYDPLALQACVKKITADAVTKIGKPQLFAIYNAKNHQPLPISIAVTHGR